MQHVTIICLKFQFLWKFSFQFQKMWTWRTLLLSLFFGVIKSPLDFCRNPNLKFATKTKACKVAGQEGSLGVIPHAPESVGKCEGMNLHTPKGASTLGVVVSMDSQIFKEQF